MVIIWAGQEITLAKGLAGLDKDGNKALSSKELSSELSSAGITDLSKMQAEATRSIAARSNQIAAGALPGSKNIGSMYQEMTGKKLDPIDALKNITAENTAQVLAGLTLGGKKLDFTKLSAPEQSIFKEFAAQVVADRVMGFAEVERLGKIDRAALVNAGMNAKNASSTPAPTGTPQPTAAPASALATNLTQSIQKAAEALLPYGKESVALKDLGQRFLEASKTEKDPNKASLTAAQKLTFESTSKLLDELTVDGKKVDLSTMPDAERRALITEATKAVATRVETLAMTGENGMKAIGTDNASLVSAVAIINLRYTPVGVPSFADAPAATTPVASAPAAVAAISPADLSKFLNERIIGKIRGTETATSPFTTEQLAKLSKDDHKLLNQMYSISLILGKDGISNGVERYQKLIASRPQEGFELDPEVVKSLASNTSALQLAKFKISCESILTKLNAPNAPIPAVAPATPATPAAPIAAVQTTEFDAFLVALRQYANNIGTVDPDHSVRLDTYDTWSKLDPTKLTVSQKKIVNECFAVGNVLGEEVTPIDVANAMFQDKFDAVKKAVA